MAHTTLTTHTIGMVIARGIESCVDGRMADGQRQEDAVVVFNLQFDFFLAVPLVVFSLGCHLQVVPVYHSLKVRDAPHTQHTRTARTAHTPHTHTHRERDG
jgi:hypothetical protein